jgi:hypothetical protein
MSNGNLQQITNKSIQLIPWEKKITKTFQIIDRLDAKILHFR